MPINQGHVDGCMDGEVDSISALPDELLHGILIYLRDTTVAARTSVLSRRWRHDDFRCKSPGCPCGLPEQKSNDVVLDSLEEVEVRNYGEPYHTVEVVKLLCDCSTMFLKRVTITISNCGQSRNMREKIHSFIHPRKSKVEINV
ncbi:hypothetical protein EJB05_11948, partial [Eragrostis curvula]